MWDFLSCQSTGTTATPIDTPVMSDNSTGCSENSFISMDPETEETEENAALLADIQSIDLAKSEREDAKNKTPTLQPPSLEELSEKYRFDNTAQMVKESQESSCDIIFAFCSNTKKGVSRGTMAWSAVLLVFTPDVLRLMREGFYWGPENIVPEYNGFDLNSTWASANILGVPKSSSFENRRYLLTDLSKECRWTACILVSSWCGTLRVLSRFQPTDLTPENLVYCSAKKNGCTIYMHSERSPGFSLNAIFDDMPLDGLWPWPKRNKDKSGFLERCAARVNVSLS